MANVILYKPKLTTLKVGTLITSPTTASSFYTQVTDEVTGGVTKWLKDVTVSGIASDEELINFLGSDTNSFQNQELEEKPFDLVKISATLAYSPVDTDKSIMGLLTGTTGTTVGSGKRYQYKAKTAKAIGLQFSDGTNLISLGFNYAKVTKIGDISQKSDSHPEVPIEMVCLIRDFDEYVETA